MFLDSAPSALSPISVVVPTRNERDNIAPLLHQLVPVLPADSEVLFVDDSDDDTPAVITEIAQDTRRLPVAIDVTHRTPDQRGGGLGTAVLLGLGHARHHWVCVMDADLQHPPGTIPRMLTARGEHRADCVVASRYCEDGHATGLDGAARGAVSRWSTALARSLFPRRLRTVSDPMSGMFLVDRDVVPLERLRPHGFKVLLEILAATPGLTVAEVGYTFGDRHAGTSKASLREGLRFATHVAGLRASSRSRSARRAGTATRVKARS